MNVFSIQFIVLFLHPSTPMFWWTRQLTRWDGVQVPERPSENQAQAGIWRERPTLWSTMTRYLQPTDWRQWGRPRWLNPQLSSSPWVPSSLVSHTRCHSDLTLGYNCCIWVSGAVKWSYCAWEQHRETADFFFFYSHSSFTPFSFVFVSLSCIPSESYEPRSLQIEKANSTLNFNVEIYAVLRASCLFNHREKNIFLGITWVR